MSLVPPVLRRGASRTDQLPLDDSPASSKPARSTIVVVGAGMAGAKLVEELLALAPDRFSIRMFGAEPHGTYNRILLSQVLGGFANPAELWLNALEWYEKKGVRVHNGVKAERIDRARGVVIGGGKVEEPYDYLVLATGSRPFVPPLENGKLGGVFAFRTLDDCQAIGGYASNCDRAVVLGGGLLGLEAARGLLSHGVEVTVVEVASHLMAQQLDAAGAAVLKATLENMGIEVRLGIAATGLVGEGSVTGVRFKDGSTIETDMVIISCGIRPNVDEAREAGLTVERGIVVDDQMRTSDPNIFAVGECVQHRGILYGVVEPLYEQARVLADVLSGVKPDAAYHGSKLATKLKVMGIDLVSMGNVKGEGPDLEVATHAEPAKGIYKKVVLRDNKLAGAIILGAEDRNSQLMRMFKEEQTYAEPAVNLLSETVADDGAAAVIDLPGDAQICNCNAVSKNRIVDAIHDGKCTLFTIGECTRAGTGCGSCQPLLSQLIEYYAPASKAAPQEVNKIEVMKREQDGLDCLPGILGLAQTNNWEQLSEDDKNRAKWHGLFFRKPTPGNFMLRLRMEAGQTNTKQLRVIADLSDEYGKGFCDLTTRQQIQLRWFTLGDVPEIWRRLEDVGLHSKQTGMDNVRGVCGCPVSGVTPHELLDARPVIREFNDMLVDKKEFTNLPRKFNVTITGCMENCCHPETQDIGLVPAYRELDGQQVNGFNVLVGGKQGSGGYRPATPLDVFVRPQEAAAACAEITRIFRDHGSRASRTRARLAFLIEDRGIPWFRAELAKRVNKTLVKAGIDLRKKHHVDHIGINPQKKPESNYPGPPLFSVGMVVPVGRIKTAQMRGVADLAERYGNGDVRVTVGQNMIITNVPENKLGALTDEPLFKDLPFDPSPIMRGLVSCTGNDYCGLALIETKGYAIEIAKELERRTEGRKLRPLTIHWSGCPAGCGMHQVSTIGLQGCRSRVNGEIVDAAHVYVNGRTGPKAQIATDVMYDVPCDQLADALEPLVKHLPR
jgi:nitrite reductase (NADH) large subunit